MPRSPTRRPTDEVKSLLTEVALELFGAGEFEATTTREIAERAGVAESVLFRHFGSKNNLLAMAISRPFDDFLEEFTAAWEQRGGVGFEEAIIREFVADLYDSLVQRRQLMRTLIAATIDDERLGEHLRDRLENVIRAIVAIGSESATARSRDVARVDTDIRVITAMITAIATLDDWFLSGSTVGRDALVDNVATLLFGGLAGRRAN